MSAKSYPPNKTRRSKKEMAPEYWYGSRYSGKQISSIVYDEMADWVEPPKSARDWLDDEINSVRQRAFA